MPLWGRRTSSGKVWIPVTAENRQHLLSGGVHIPTGNYAGVRLLQLGSDLQKDLTCTGLSPSPARLKLQSSSYCLRHGLFVFSVFYHRDIISRRGGLVKRFSHFSDSVFFSPAPSYGDSDRCTGPRSAGLPPRLPRSSAG